MKKRNNTLSKQKNIVCIIPARLNSSRFPQKILTNLSGKPLLQWVWQAANKTTFFNNVIFAIDSPKTSKNIQSFGGKYIMTSQNCKNGTERLIEIVKSKKFNDDIFVNWQADEPFINSIMIKTLLQSCHTDSADIWTLKKRITKKKDILSPNIVKVVCDKDNFALYFSRNPIPHYRDKKENKTYYKHIGIYAYKKETLLKISNLKQCDLENAEKLEQLRFLHNKISIRVHETNQDVIGIDTPQDLQKAENYIKKGIVG